MPKILLLAMSLMTRIPIPEQEDIQSADFARASLFFPLAGFLIGLCLVLPALVLTTTSSLLLAAVLTILWAVITGGLHLKGVSSSSDAWIGGLGDKEKTHRILNDQITGDAGTTAIAAVLLLKFAALTVLLDQGFLWTILFAPVFGRALILLLFMTTPCIQAEGLASAVSTYLPRDLVRLILAICLLFAVIISVKGLVVMLAGFWVLRHQVLHRFDGCTLDTAGASVEFGEVSWLVGVALLV